MKTITFKSNFGRFAYNVESEIGDDVNAETTNLAIRGLADTAFRGVASDVEKGLVKAGKMTKDTKRSDVEYSTESAGIVQSLAKAKLDAIAKEATLPMMVFTVTGEHVYGESGEVSRVQATELWTQVQGFPDAKFQMACEIYGIPKDADDDAAIEACHTFLRGLRKKK